jgi:hypothetical protein
MFLNLSVPKDLRDTVILDYSLGQWEDWHAVEFCICRGTGILERRQQNSATVSLNVSVQDFCLWRAPYILVYITATGIHEPGKSGKHAFIRKSVPKSASYRLSIRLSKIHGLVKTEILELHGLLVIFHPSRSLSKSVMILTHSSYDSSPITLYSWENSSATIS